MPRRQLNAVSASLMLVDWQVFGTLTWRSSRLGSVRSRESDVWEFLREISEGNRDCSRFFEMPICVRWERGEAGGRPHAHFLMAGLSKVSVDWCFKCSAKWFVSRGLGRLRVYGMSNRAGEIVSYVTKGFSCTNRKNTYELGKFSDADRLVINKSAWRTMLERSGAAATLPQHRTG